MSLIHVSNAIMFYNVINCIIIISGLIQKSSFSDPVMRSFLGNVITVTEPALSLPFLSLPPVTLPPSSRADVQRILRSPRLWANTGHEYKQAAGAAEHHCLKPQYLGHQS